MTLSTRKDGDLSSYPDNIDDSQNGIKSSSLSKILIDNLHVVANREKVKGQLPLEQIFRIRIL